MQQHPGPRVSLAFDTGTGPWDGYLYLSPPVPDIVTLEPVLDVLNGEGLFIPVGVDEPPFMWLVNKRNLRCVRWAFPDRDRMERCVPWDRRERIQCRVLPETRLNGYLVMVYRREGTPRVRDYLNGPDPFVAVLDRDNPVIWIVNKRYMERLGHVHD